VAAATTTNSAGELIVQGALSLDNTATTRIFIGGTTAGSGFSQIAQHGTSSVALNGTLDVSFTNGFQNTIRNSDTFNILTSNNTVTGAFSNVASGNRVTTSDGIGSFLVTYAGQKTVILSDFLPSVSVSSVVSRQSPKNVNLDIPLNLTGNYTIECRRGGPAPGGTYQVVFTFAYPLTNAPATSATGTYTSTASSFGADQTTWVVNLAGVTNEQVLGITLSNVNDTQNEHSDSIAVQMGILIGDATGGRDANGNPVVSSADVSFVKAHSGKAATPGDLGTIRADVTADGVVNSADVSLTKSKSGTGITSGTGAPVHR